MEKALIILADGFEEIEAVSVIDILRRANISVTIAALSSLHCTSARNMTVMTNCLLNDTLDTLYDILILPGGEPGTTRLENSPLVAIALQNHVHAKRWVAAICAAPRILNKAGYLEGKKATSFPETKIKMDRCIYSEELVVVDEPFITSRGAGTALHFAYTLVEKLQSKAQADTLRKSMVFQ